MKKRLVYNRDTRNYEEHRNPRWRVVLRRIWQSAAAVAVAAGAFWLLFVKLGLDLPKTAILKRNKAVWEARLDVLRHKIDVCEGELENIEARNNLVYRSIFALEEIPAAALADTSVSGMEMLGLRLDNLHTRIDTQMVALGEVALVAKQAGDMVSCIPAVPPLQPRKGTYHLSSPFGVRTDPVYGGKAMHNGQDFASFTGNPVYATGDGTVEKVDFKYSGYGNEVLIDHGFGYKTRYAHLSTVDVGVGQSLRRGDKIGEVGRSGKSTGPHLHYEVLYRGAAVNPMSFMDMSMPLSEYRAMIAKRQAENANLKPSASSLGERQKKQGTSGRQ